MHVRREVCALDDIVDGRLHLQRLSRRALLYVHEGAQFGRLKWKVLMESNMVTSLIPYLNFWRLRPTGYVFSAFKVQPQSVDGAIVVEKVREVEPQQPRVLVPLHKFPPVVHSLVLAQEGLELAPPEIGLL